MNAFVDNLNYELLSEGYWSVTRPVMHLVSDPGQVIRPCVMVGKKISDYRTIVPPRKVFFSGGTYPRLMVEKRNRTFFLCHTAHKNSDFSHFPMRLFF